MMNKVNLEKLIKSTDFFANECILKNTLAISEKELKSIISKELKSMKRSEVDDFVSDLLDIYKMEILNQDKKAYRNVIQEVDRQYIGYITEHRHPRGRFITTLDNNMTMYVSTISRLIVENYSSKDEMIANIILKQCFNIEHNSSQNNLCINATVNSADYIFSKKILKYIKYNLNNILNEILKSNILLTYKNQDNYNLFKEYLKNTVSNIIFNSSKELPKNINVGDKLQTKYCETATVIDIDTESETLKLDKEIQNDITVFTDVISYKNENIINKIISPQKKYEDIEMEA